MWDKLTCTFSNAALFKGFNTQTSGQVYLNKQCLNSFQPFHYSNLRLFVFRKQNNKGQLFLQLALTSRLFENILTS